MPAASFRLGVPYGWPVRSLAPVGRLCWPWYFWSIHSPLANRRTGAATCQASSASRPVASTSLTVMT